MSIHCPASCQSTLQFYSLVEFYVKPYNRVFLFLKVVPSRSLFGSVSCLYFPPNVSVINGADFKVTHLQQLELLHAHDTAEAAVQNNLSLHFSGDNSPFPL